MQMIKNKKKLTGGIEVNESDGYCAALPYFLYGHSFKDIEKIIKTVTVSKLSIKYALAKFHILDLALKGSKDPISEINVTPFVDVMLVLLIIFMVTAPLLTVGVQVDLPESSADTLPEEQEPLTLTINSKGEIFIQESKVEYDKIIAKVLAVSKNRTDTRIYVRGDKTINYGRVLEIMGLLSGSGFTKVALISEPYKER